MELTQTSVPREGGTAGGLLRTPEGPGAVKAPLNFSGLTFHQSLHGGGQSMDRSSSALGIGKELGVGVYFHFISALIIH